MTTDYDKYEAACATIRESNKTLLADFARWLEKSNLSEKTVDKHVENTNFYINEYLLYEDVTNPEDGAHRIGDFLGYWFIHKAMWASKAQIKSNAASLKKFYMFMFEQQLITEEDFAELKETVKAEMPEWLATVSRYDDPSIENMDEIWGL